MVGRVSSQSRVWQVQQRCCQSKKFFLYKGQKTCTSSAHVSVMQVIVLEETVWLIIGQSISRYFAQNDEITNGHFLKYFSIYRGVQFIPLKVICHSSGDLGIT